MFINEMTEDQKWELIGRIEEQWRATDDPEFKAMVLACNQDVSEKAKLLHKESIIIDACTFNVVRYGWLQEAKATALNCTVPGVFDGPGEAFKAIVGYYGVVNSDDRFRLILSTDDIYRAKKQGQTGLIIGAQSCGFVQSLEMEPYIQAFKRMGLRIMQIGYNFRTFAADGCYSPANAGLSDTGMELIKLMEQYGITVDLSHAGERSTLESLDMATKPQIFSHSNPKRLFDHPRNITDEQAKKCASTDGVVGVTAYNVMLWDGKTFPTIETFLDCVEYFCDLIGVDHVGIGLDTTATEGCYPKDELMYFNKLVRKVSGEKSVTYQALMQNRKPPLGNAVEGLMCLANWVNLIEHMLKRGFSEEEIKKLIGENWLRVFEKTWKPLNLEEERY